MKAEQQIDRYLAEYVVIKKNTLMYNDNNTRFKIERFDQNTTLEEKKVTLGIAYLYARDILAGGAYLMDKDMKNSQFFKEVVKLVEIPIIGKDEVYDIYGDLHPMERLTDTEICEIEFINGSRDSVEEPWYGS